MQPAPAIIAITALTLAGCLEAPGGPAPPQPQCETSPECAGYLDGAVCYDGLCYGTPPEELRFGAQLVPPDDRDELVASEVRQLTIARDGTIDGLSFAPAIVLSGRVVLVDQPDLSVAARIRIRRPSRIAGGPTFLRNEAAEAGASAGDAAFRIALPPTLPDDPPYDITIFPLDGPSEQGAPPTPAEQAPPAHYTLVAMADQSDLEWKLGDSDGQREVDGRVVDAAGRGVGGLQVSMLARPSIIFPFEQISSLGKTDEDGHYKLNIPKDLDEAVDLVVAPSPGTLAPTLRLPSMEIPGPQWQDPVALEPVVMPSFPNPVSYVLPVLGPDPAGGMAPEAGANVRLTLQLETRSDVQATYTATGTTDQDGNVALDLIPGGDDNRRYLADVAPSPLSPHSGTSGWPVDVGPPAPGVDNMVLLQIVLSFRVAVGGQLLDALGEPLAGATVRAAPSAGFRAGLDADQQVQLDSLRFPEVGADEHGGFILWLDPELSGAAATYELDFIPPSETRAPRWSQDDLAVPEPEGGLTTLDLGSIMIPPASFARGVVTANGAPVPGAEVHLYQLDDDARPARLRGLFRSGDDGWVIAVLPNP